MSDALAAGILAERRAEWDHSLERFDDAVTRMERLIELAERAREVGDRETVERLAELLARADEIAGIRHDETAVARAAVIDARLAVSRTSTST